MAPTITAYFDESGTHSNDDVTVMAGFVADARQWRKYHKRVSGLFRRYRVDIFHAIDVRRGSGCFKGWTVDRKIRFSDEFMQIVAETTEFGYACWLNDEDYKWYRLLDWSRRPGPQAKYTILARAAIWSAVDSALKSDRWAFGEEPRLEMIFEDGHPRRGGLTDYYNALRKMCDDHKALSGVAFRSKRDCLPLAASDQFAYTVYQELTGGKKLGVNKSASKADASYRNNFFHLGISRQSLGGLYAQAIPKR